MNTGTLLISVATLLTAFACPQCLQAAGKAEPPQARLSRNGVTKWTVYLPPGAGEVERFAARELTRYLEQMCGAKFVEAKKPGKLTIQIGLRKALPAVKGMPPAKAGFDGYSLLIEPGRVVIAGDSPIGVLYGVYDALERLGCRWFQPALDPRDPEVVPRLADLALPAGRWSEASPLKLRIYNGSAFFFDLKPDQMIPQLDWAAKNRYNGVSWQAHHRPGAVGEEMELMKNSGVLAQLDQRGLFLHGPCHSFPFFLPSAKYFDAHPEWFGLYDGQRRKHGDALPLINYCWSNPEANAQFISNVESFLKQYPQIKVFCPVWIDGGALCACVQCRQRGGSDLIVDLFNQMSDRLEKNCPAVTLEAVCGYAPALEPPTNAAPNGKWQAVYAHWGRNHRQSYGDPDYANRASLAKWRGAFKNFELCSYYAAASHQPFNGAPYLHALEGDTRYFVSNNLVGTYVLQYPHGFWWNYAFDLGVAGRYPYYYPAQKPAAQLRDYVLNYFGPAAGPVLLDYFQALSDDLDVSYRASRGDANERDYQELQRLAGTLRRALALCQGGPPYAYRVRKLQASHRILTRWSTALRHVRGIKQKYQELQDNRAARAEVDKAIAAAKVYASRVLEETAQAEKQFPGTATAEWLESWYVNRVFRGPIKEIETKLAREP
jgi:hypothetical protein